MDGLDARLHLVSRKMAAAMNDSIGRLVRVDLREVWKHEAHDFTQWLQHNIELLNEATGLSLTVFGREHRAGSFSCDLVAEDESGRKVVIENQLERSNHDHLGKVITYLSHLGAETAVWIVSDPRPEHIGAMAWLNESSSASFYMVKVEAVRVKVADTDSAAAPLFTMIVGPTAEIKNVAADKREDAERHRLRRAWWESLLERGKGRSPINARISPNDRGYTGASSGVPHLSLNYVVWQDSGRVELYIDRSNTEENKRIFDDLLARRTEIESAFGGMLNWERLDHRRASRISSDVEGGGYRSPAEDWPDIQEDMLDAMKRFGSALRPYIDKHKDA